MRVAIGADHAGYKLKEFLKKRLQDCGYSIVDVGTFSEDSVDYPDYAYEVSNLIVNGKADFGVLVCGTGLGMSIAANKIRGIRAAACSNIFESIMSRRHNDANIICVGSRVIGDEHAFLLVKTFLEEPFEGGRHQRRVEKIKQLEEKG
ncbi:MAG: ribose 5-phosphate isomerase B [Actinobacteria bacterium]|nr:ribose 5-phosphate isomerase B [Actinomycetota bacterium]